MKLPCCCHVMQGWSGTTACIQGCACHYCFCLTALHSVTIYLIICLLFLYASFNVPDVSRTFPLFCIFAQLLHVIVIVFIAVERSRHLYLLIARHVSSVLYSCPIQGLEIFSQVLTPARVLLSALGVAVNWSTMLVVTFHFVEVSVLLRVARFLASVLASQRIAVSVVDLACAQALHAASWFRGSAYTFMSAAFHWLLSFS